MKERTNETKYKTLNIHIYIYIYRILLVVFRSDIVFFSLEDTFPPSPTTIKTGIRLLKELVICSHSQFHSTVRYVKEHSILFNFILSFFVKSKIINCLLQTTYNYISIDAKYSSLYCTTSMYKVPFLAFFVSYFFAFHYFFLLSPAPLFFQIIFLLCCCYMWSRFFSFFY